MYIFLVCDPLTKNVSQGIMAKKLVTQIPRDSFKNVRW